MSQPVIIQNEHIVGAGVSSASQQSFDNAGTGLTSTNVQNAIEEVNAKKLSLTGGTVTGKVTFGNGIALSSASSRNDMPFFLGIDAFADGGTVKWIDKGSVADDIGAVKKSGSEITGKITRNAGGGYIYERDNVAVDGTSHGQSSGNSYNPVVGQKTNSGHWSMGNLSGYEELFFVYTTDANYTSHTNTGVGVKLPATAGTIAINGSSSRRYKENIESMSDEFAKKLLELNPVKFDYIDKTQGVGCYGLIAEEVEEVEDYAVIHANEEIEGVDYLKFIPQLIKMIQIQQKEIEELKKLKEG